MRKRTIQLTAAFVLTVGCLQYLTSCNLVGRGTGGEELGSSSERRKAFELINDANTNIKSIKVLYRENNAKISELETALKEGNLKKVKRLADELSLAINDGYILAESVMDKIEKARSLNINITWKRYLDLKEESLKLQIRAFDYRRDSAKLFRDKIGSEDKATLKLARDTFSRNEEAFKKHMADAQKVSKEADEVRRESLRKK